LPLWVRVVASGQKVTMELTVSVTQATSEVDVELVLHEWSAVDGVGIAVGDDDRLAVGTDLVEVVVSDAQVLVLLDTEESVSQPVAAEATAAMRATVAMEYFILTGASGLGNKHGEKLYGRQAEV